MGESKEEFHNGIRIFDPEEESFEEEQEETNIENE
jgi:hypothetical protein